MPKPRKTKVQCERAAIRAGRERHKAATFAMLDADHGCVGCLSFYNGSQRSKKAESLIRSAMHEYDEFIKLNAGQPKNPLVLIAKKDLEFLEIAHKFMKPFGPRKKSPKSTPKPNKEEDHA